MTTEKYSYSELVDYLASKHNFRMAHVYKPIMLLEVLRRGGRASKEQIAEAFLLRDVEQLSYYKTKVVHPLSGQHLVEDNLLERDRDDYVLAESFRKLKSVEFQGIEKVLEQRIDDYLKHRNSFGNSNHDAVPGSMRYRVLKEAGNRCELCGASSRDVLIDVDHILPRSRKGRNNRENLQALCRTCNSQKSTNDDTSFGVVHESYDHRDPDCRICKWQVSGERIMDENSLAYVVRDSYPVTPGHTLISPKRHEQDYFELHGAERNAIDQLLQIQKASIAADDPTVAGWNIGINCGKTAGQSIMHVHVHLIPRREGDMENPRGGVRGVIPHRQKY